MMSTANDGRGAARRMRKVAGSVVVLFVMAMLAVPAGAAPPQSPPGQAPITPPARPAEPGRPTDPGSGSPGTPVEISVADAQVAEGDGTAEVTISLSATSSFSTTVDWATADGTAAAGSDYTAAGGTATIPATETTATVSVPITDDGVVEGDETFTVLLSNPSANATITDGTATVTVTDDDTPTSGPTLSIDDTTVIEGLDALVTIRLSEPATESVHVSGDVNQGTATFFDDILTSGFSTSILTGEDEVTVNLPTFRSSDTEPETFEVVISSTTVPVDDDTAVVTIIDDPQAGAASCVDDGLEPNDGPGPDATDTQGMHVVEGRACPEDLDVFSIPQALGATVEIEVLYDTSLTDLSVVLTQGESVGATGQPFAEDIVGWTHATTCPRDTTTGSTTSARTGECLSYTIAADPSAGPVHLEILTESPAAGVPYQVFFRLVP